MKKMTIIIGMCVLLLTTVSFGAATPRLITYQGMLADDAGIPLTGTYGITFRLYDAGTAGNLEWTEIQSAVEIENGLFSVLLGEVTVLDLPFDESYWLEVEVDGEIMPRMRFTSVGYAFRSLVADHAIVADSARVAIAITDTLASKILESPALDTKVSGTAVLDEDDMASDSDSSLATQQSIKAYVDNQVVGGDFADTTFSIYDDADNTRVLAIETGSITSGNTRTLSVPDYDGTIATVAGTETLTNKTLTSPVLNTDVSGSAVLDEDDMASDDPSKLATQLSIKAYVDNQVVGGDFADTTFSIYDDADNTRVLAIETGNITSGNTRTLSVPDYDCTIATIAGTETLTNKTLTSPVLNTDVSGSAVLDEDDMFSDDSAKLATQQSIKAYVDNQVVGGDFADTTFSIYDNADNSKVLAIETGSITSGNTRTLSVPDYDGTISTVAGTETLTNKTLTSPVLNTDVSGSAVLDEDDMFSDDSAKLATQQSIKAYVDNQVVGGDFADTTFSIYDNADNSKVLAIETGSITSGNTRTLSVPDYDGTISTVAGTETLTNKTLTSPTIETSPTAAGATWTDLGTVTTADIDGGTIDGATIGATTPAAGNFSTADIDGGTIDNAIIGGTTPAAAMVTTITATDSVLIEDPGAGTFTVTLHSPDPLGASYALTLPADDGDADQVLATDGSGVLSWTTASVGDVVSGDAFTNGGSGSVLYFQGTTSGELTVTAPGVAGTNTLTLPATTGTLMTNVVQDTLPQLGGQLDVNGEALGDGTDELLKFIETASAVNELTIANAAAGNAPQLSATGDDTDIDLTLTPKGTGNILLSGNVGIGTAAPTSKLHVAGDIRWDANAYLGMSLGVTPIVNFDAMDWLAYDRTNNRYSYYINAGTAKLNIDPTGIGIGRYSATNRLEVEGAVSKTTPGGWGSNSDSRIKTDVQDIEEALSTISELRPVMFKYTEEYKQEHPSIEDVYYYNFIAQEYMDVFPQSVKGSGDTLSTGEEILQMDAYFSQVMAIKAIQELKAENEALIAENEAQQDAINDLEKRLTKLERKGK